MGCRCKMREPVVDSILSLRFKETIMTRPLGLSLVGIGRMLAPAVVLFTIVAARVASGQGAAEGAAAGEDGVIRAVDGEALKEDSGYYIGVVYGNLSEELRDKLGLEPGKGVFVSQVVPDSPAAKSGLKADDVIVAVNKQPLSSLEQLVKAVADTKDRVMVLQIVRQGERHNLEVRPARRPAGGGIVGFSVEDEKSKEVIQRLRRQLEELQKQEAAQREKAEAARDEATKAEWLRKLEAARVEAAKAEALKRAEDEKATWAKRLEAAQAAKAEADKAEAHRRAELEKAEAYRRAEAAKAEAHKQAEAARAEREKADAHRKAEEAKAAAAGGGGQGGIRFRIEGADLRLAGPQPGAAPNQARVVFAGAPQALPDDMKVTIDKQGKQPATIIVEQGAKMWKTTENELEMLPAEARAYASRVLGRPAAGHWGGLGGAPGMPGMAPGPARGGFGGGGGGAAPGGAPGPRFEFKLDPQGQVTPPGPQFPPGARIKNLEGGRIQIELHEADEKKAETKNPPEKTEVRWLELKRPEPAPDKVKQAEQETRELTEKLHELRQQLEELRKTAEPKK